MPEYPSEKFESRRIFENRRIPLDWRTVGGHAWSQVSGGVSWACSQCLRFALDEDSARSSPRCTPPATLAQLSLNDLGHSLLLVVTDLGSAMLCSTCGAFATNVPRKLALPCVGQAGKASRGGFVAMSRVRSARSQIQDTMSGPGSKRDRALSRVQGTSSKIRRPLQSEGTSACEAIRSPPKNLALEKYLRSA